MQNEIVIETSGTQDIMVYKEACVRAESGVIVTKARPGRRYVELARLFGDLSYVSSICNADWSPAMTGIASLIARQFQRTCFPEQLQWDPVESKSSCDVFVEYENAEICPFELETGAKAIPNTEVVDGLTLKSLYCPLPKLAAALACAGAEGDIDPANFGWYYCEDSASCKFNLELTQPARDMVKGHRVVVNCLEDLVCE